MSSETYIPYTYIPSCKWCGIKDSEISFENAKLCRACHEKALRAAQNPKLCEHCSSIAVDEGVSLELFSENGYTHMNHRALEMSSSYGCGLCRMFLLQDPNHDMRRLDTLLLFAEGDVSEDGSGRDIKSLYFSSESDMFRLQMAVSAAPGDPAARFVTQRPVEANLGEDGTIVQIRQWLDECLSTHNESIPHDEAHPSSARFPLPTRVLDVGTETEPAMRLFQPSCVQYADYVALSYVWGASPFLKTVSSNLEAHLECLKEIDLPQTFIDAINITRNLGLRYLWVDALCIIQDSPDDKRVEIGAMEQTYANSTLTVAIVNATGAAEGFLKTKPRLTVDLPYRCPDGTFGSVQVSPQETVDLSQAILYTRAWCLQENLLSPRLLLFTDTEVIWQCESHPMRRPDTNHVQYIDANPQLGASPFARIPKSVSSAVTQDHTQDHTTPLDPDLELARYKTWIRIVENYTKRNITNLSDRLPAIAGIAQKFKTAWSDEYCAGIWKRHFIASLSWRRGASDSWRSGSDKKQYFPPLTEYRAPSWSWASIEGPVHFDSRLDLGNARGLGAKLLSVGVMPLRDQVSLGEAHSGEAILEASLIPVRDLPIRGNGGLGQDAQSFRTGGQTVLDDQTWLDPSAPSYPYFMNEELKEHAWAMLLGEGRDGEGKMTRTVALILLPLIDRPETFQRVGIWESSVKASSKLWVGSKNRRKVIII
ncbi:hypothetical protein D0Z07_4316 [Hyphodiscus hymeniophilus]|uniref:Heterokaryon incompatibility domain-containing protein n=1 Tax=Hyphodiscus hymeniophilus TaxID=353542 RepID=A0A9P6VJV8_9HELO|nr:hypothetical protein D0Z07_4316 [Hyphodiscus hymeniophilus]